MTGILGILSCFLNVMTKLTVSTKVYAPLAHVRNCMRNPEHITHRAFADAETRYCPWAKGSEPKVGETFTTRMEAKDGSFGWYDRTVYCCRTNATFFLYDGWDERVFSWCRTCRWCLISRRRIVWVCDGDRNLWRRRNPWSRNAKSRATGNLRKFQEACGR